jgi:hypothetical protein
MKKRARLPSTTLLTLLLTAPGFAEMVDVKYYGALDLAPFVCKDYTRSSFVKGICYDQSKAFMVIKLNATYYPHCEIDSATVALLHSTESMAGLQWQREGHV